MSHTMHLQMTNAANQELWVCPVCDRRLLFTWPPHYQKIVLKEGDVFVGHAGGKGGLTIGGVMVTPQEETE